jgi:hypothetical protein
VQQKFLFRTTDASFQLMIGCLIHSRLPNRAFPMNEKWESRIFKFLNSVILGDSYGGFQDFQVSFGFRGRACSAISVSCNCDRPNASQIIFRPGKRKCSGVASANQFSVAS